jgi:hypothetical protein
MESKAFFHRAFYSHGCVENDVVALREYPTTSGLPAMTLVLMGILKRC